MAVLEEGVGNCDLLISCFEDNSCLCIEAQVSTWF